LATSSLTSRKRALRKSLSSVLQALSQDDIRAQSSAIVTRILSASWFDKATTVSCYLSMPAGEVDTSTITSAILHSGKKLFVPRVDAALPGGMDLLRIYDDEDLRSLPSGVWGIKEPTFQYGDAPRMKATDGDSDPLDVILIPGVGFDRSFSRLGHGKGYYDRFLSSYSTLTAARARPRPLFVALALREQVLAAGQVPVGTNDVPIDVIVTPDETIAVDEDTSAST